MRLQITFLDQPKIYIKRARRSLLALLRTSMQKETNNVCYNHGINIIFYNVNLNTSSNYYLVCCWEFNQHVL